MTYIFSINLYSAFSERPVKTFKDILPRMQNRSKRCFFLPAVWRRQSFLSCQWRNFKKRLLVIIILYYTVWVERNDTNLNLGWARYGTVCRFFNNSQIPQKLLITAYAQMTILGNLSCRNKGGLYFLQLSSRRWSNRR